MLGTGEVVENLSWKYPSILDPELVTQIRANVISHRQLT